MSTQRDKSWMEIGATIGAAVDLASYAHSKLTDAEPVREQAPAAPVVTKVDGDPTLFRWLKVSCVAAVIALGVALFLGTLQAPETAARPTRNYAPRSESMPAAPQAGVPQEGISPGARLAGHVVKLAILALF